MSIETRIIKPQSGWGNVSEFIVEFIQDDDYIGGINIERVIIIPGFTPPDGDYSNEKYINNVLFDSCRIDIFEKLSESAVDEIKLLVIERLKKESEEY
jgi:hypothetical protein